MNDPTQHSADFIAEMKGVLGAEKQQLEQELGQIAHKDATAYEANYPDYERDEEANAMEMADFEGLNATTKVAQERLGEVNKALRAIEEGRYGITEDGQTIPEDRLRANPAATTLVTS